MQVPEDFFVEFYSTSQPDTFNMVINSNDDYEKTVKKIILNETKNLSETDFEEQINKRLQDYEGVISTKKKVTSSVNVGNPRLKEDIKQLYRYICQICETQIKTKGWKSNLQFREEMRYLTSDGHHITPLNKGGLDHPSNIICVCPNCHRRLHSGEYEIIFTAEGPKCKNTLSQDILPIKLETNHTLIK